MLFGGAAEAAQIRVDFAGTQTGGTVSLPGGPAKITGWFIYDDAAPNQSAAANEYSAFSIFGGSWSVQDASNGFVCGGSQNGPNAQLNVSNDRSTSVGPRDVVAGAITSQVGCLSATTTTIVRLLASGPSTAWADILPNAGKWTDADLDFRQILLQRSTGEQAFVFNVTSLTAAPVAEVPLPASAPLLLIGLAALRGLRRNPNQAK